jgi:hypothetical protein
LGESEYNTYFKILCKWIVWLYFRPLNLDKLVAEGDQEEPWDAANSDSLCDSTVMESIGSKAHELHGLNSFPLNSKGLVEGEHNMTTAAPTGFLRLW